MLTYSIVAILIVAVVSQETETCTMKRLDDCGYKIMRSVTEKNTFPSNQEEQTKICDEMKEGQKCLELMETDCPNFVPKKLSEDFIESVKTNIQSICDIGTPLQKKIIKNGACINEAIQAEGSKCMTEFVDSVAAAVNSRPKDKRLAYVCCGMVKYDKCFYESLGKKCSSEAARTGRRIVQGFAIFMAETCLGYLADPKKCNDLPPIAPFKDDLKTIIPGATVIMGNLDRDQA